MNPFFVESFDTKAHPVKNIREKIRNKYIIALTYVIEEILNNDDKCEAEKKNIIIERLNLYKMQLFPKISISDANKKLGNDSLIWINRRWKKIYQYIFVCDIALILFDNTLLSIAIAKIKESLSTKRQSDIEHLIQLLHNENDIEKKYKGVNYLIEQYRANREFILKTEKRIIITANMSAGKSTLINAFVGKPVSRTSQEACTENICYLFNKPYEDGNVHLLTQRLNLNASEDDLKSYKWDDKVSIASFFSGFFSDNQRLCVIDTPGVDSALYREHGKRTKDALLNENYDVLIYVVTPTRLGTDAEKKYLQWISHNIKQEKIIFILNKLDDYHDLTDSVEESIKGLRDDLRNIGFENPIICPISAYFSYLIKRKILRQTFSTDEADEYVLYSKKFRRSIYDLSKYYKNIECLPTDSEEIELSKRSGLYGLEKIVFAGDNL